VYFKNIKEKKNATDLYIHKSYIHICFFVLKKEMKGKHVYQKVEKYLTILGLPIMI
jgi:hypothetical protein